MRFFAQFLIVVLVMWGGAVSHAHRFYAAFTQIDLQDKTRTMEITHRLFTHDVEDFLHMEQGNVAHLSDGEIEGLLKTFVERNFAVFDRTGARLSLTWIAMEYQTDSVHIYQEAPLPDDPSELTIINRLFMDLFEDQKNTVNVAWAKKIRTVIFMKGNGQQKVSFSRTD